MMDIFPTSLTLQQLSGTILAMYGELFSKPVLLFAAELLEVLVQVATFLSLMSLGCAMVKVFMVVFKG